MLEFIRIPADLNLAFVHENRQDDDIPLVTVCHELVAGDFI